jgi:hypothetical protein
VLFGSDGYEVNVDPGFLNERMCMSFIGPSIIAEITLRFPALLLLTDPFGVKSRSVFLSDRVLAKCRNKRIPTLAAVLHDLREGTVFASLERVAPGKLRSDNERIQKVIGQVYDARTIILDFSPEHFVSTTMRVLLTEGAPVSIIGRIHSFDEKQVVIQPLVIGLPVVTHNSAHHDLDYSVIWPGYETFEIHAENIDEFSECRKIMPPALAVWQSQMKNLPEKVIKARLADLLGDTTGKDWGGEQMDHFTPALHIGGKRVTAAFLLKGPARFSPMTLSSNQGKANDQLYRLATVQADLLIVQHAHDIDHKVRHVLAALARYAYQPRYYCFIDGKDTYRILKAYGKLGS